MTIKEIETLSGLTRANIRFYEEEGFITPARGENGYRDYSEEDLAVLKKIKLLRMLHISLGEIKSLQKGEQSLRDALETHLEKLAQDKSEIGHSQKVCKTMQEDGAVYETLDAELYLTSMKTEEEATNREITRDVQPRHFIPWRRFFARYLDYMLYETIWMIFSAVVLNQNLGGNATLIETVFNSLMGLLLMMVIEPVLFSRFGTTIGKWILGIRITDNDGGKLSYAGALERTGKVVWHGMCLRIPVCELILNYKCFNAYMNGETLAWERDSELTVKDEAYWRVGAMVAGFVATVVALAVGISYAELPKNRGDITVAEFAENYNRYMDYLEIDAEYKLDSNGEWEKKAAGDVLYFYMGGESPRPEFEFTVEDGYMTGLYFEQEMNNRDTSMSTYVEERILAIMAFALAQEGIDFDKVQVKELVNELNQYPFKSFYYEVYGVTINCEVTYSGYDVIETQGMLVSDEGADTEFSIVFSMQK